MIKGQLDEITKQKRSVPAILDDLKSTSSSPRFMASSNSQIYTEMDDRTATVNRYSCYSIRQPRCFDLKIQCVTAQ